MVRIGPVLNKLFSRFTNLVAGKPTLLVVDRPEVGVRVSVAALEVPKELIRVFRDLARVDSRVRAQDGLRIRLALVLYNDVQKHHN